MFRRISVSALFVALLCSSLHAAIPDRERAALLALYTATNGQNWNISSGWGGPAGTECNWYAVECDEAQTTVTSVVLGFNNLSGTIPHEIGDLTNLARLNLVASNLGGTIPAEIAQLKKLQELQLTSNNLTGTIPPSLGTLTNVTNLELDGNQLSGTIPPELGNLAQIATLHLGFNQLTGGIPVELTHLSKLTVLELNDNKLSGSLPDFSGLPQLAELALQDNGFTGSIPSSIGQLTNLDQLFLQSNNLTGSIPPQAGNLTKVRDFVVSYNKLSGALPNEIYSLTNLEDLDVFANTLTGTLSSAVGRLTKLQQLSLGRNSFTGALPAELTSLSQLQTLDLSSNTFSGTIPNDIDRLTLLRSLNLGDNGFTGTIPTSIGNLQKLEGLGLYQNQLTGTIPSQLANATKLADIELYNNQLTGTIPDSFRTLKDLYFLYLSGNKLSGPLPNWLPELPKLRDFLVNGNNFTGPIPANITSITTLDYLDLGVNQLSGPLPFDIGNLQNLEYLTLEDNEFTGAIPDSFWTLRKLIDVRVGGLHLTGTIPAAIRNFAQIDNFDVHDNDLSGVLPPEIGSLTTIRYLDLGGNRFTGTLPRELGQLKRLQAVDFSANNFRSPIPPEIEGMGIVDGGADFAYNALSTSDPTLQAFLNRIQFDHDFVRSQTITPQDIRVTSATDRGAVVEWTPIAYQYDEGGYRVFASLTQGGAPAAIATTSSKEVSSITVRGLQPSTTYFFSVAAVTHPHDFQRNLIVSDISSTVSATTGARTLAPADVVLTATPSGLIQIDGVAQNEDSFTLTNFGDLSTSITLELYDNDFYSATPAAFTLAGGASQNVKITSIAKQPAGVRYGGIVPRGEGTSDEDIVTVTLLSASRAGGNAIAEPLTSRVEIAGDPGSDSVGQVSFRNKGTATLTGILVADVPWLVPDSQAITIDPGNTALVRFRVVRSRRPSGVADGALTGTLSLIYVGAIPGGSSFPRIEDTTPPASISISKVTVVDVTKPEVGNANAPSLAANEVAYFIAGLTTGSSSSSALASDLHIVNALGAKPANDIRLYYSSTAINAVANLTSLGSNQSVTLPNVVSNVYGASNQTGSLQVRSANWRNLIVNATLLRLASGGTFTGDMPVFRSDRALKPNEKLYLTGVAQSQTVHATVYLEEITGVAADVLVSYVDSTGTVVGSHQTQMPGYSSTQLTDAPQSTSTIVVANASTGSSASVLAYVRMSDDTSGDTWSVVDWSRLYDYRRTETTRVPMVEGVSSTGGGKRRIVAPHDNTKRVVTSLALFNPDATEARASLKAGSISKEVTIPARQTLTIGDLAAFIGTTVSQSVTIEPLRGQLAASTRSGASTGTAMPIVASRSGLRVGQSQIFAGLEDSSATRTDYGFVETSGARTTIRATLLLSDARSLFTAVVSRDVTLDANGFVYVNDLVRSIAGSIRSQYGDLHNLQLQLEVVDGNGSILPFVVLTDNASGDTVLRLE